MSPAPCPYHDTDPLLVGHLARIQPADGLQSQVHAVGTRGAASLASAAPCRVPQVIRTAARSRRCTDRVSPGREYFCTVADRRRSALRASAGAPSDAGYVVAGGPTWFVATEIDFDSTLVACTRACGKAC